MTHNYGHRSRQPAQRTRAVGTRQNGRLLAPGAAAARARSESWRSNIRDGRAQTEQKDVDNR